MKIKDQLSKQERTHLQAISKREEEKLSKNDWLDLMGAKKSTFKRVHGRIRRK
ncbi:hypothetical protein [Heyndrickxia acidicola]|uniref:Uncharacterized protein n=1 Tax=Heyndrickxia acidicola TaxID=209389 RepID=A0ABU6MD60_9BACI|nr:hypothetical protein [Heyndrickxia acidicola]MED1201966.1 hypothetical protein [Heyndrickxia acidicola]